MAHVVRRDRAVVVGLSFVAVLSCGCQRTDPAPAAAASDPPSARPAPASELHEATFDLVMKPVGAVIAGQASAVEIAVLIPLVLLT